MGSVSPRSDLPIPGLPRRFPVSCAFRRAPPPSVVLIRVPDASAQLPKPVTAVVPAYPHGWSPTPCFSSASPVKDEFVEFQEEQRRPPGGSGVGAANEPRRPPSRPEAMARVMFVPLLRVCCCWRCCVHHGMPETSFLLRVCCSAMVCLMLAICRVQN